MRTLPCLSLVALLLAPAFAGCFGGAAPGPGPTEAADDLAPPLPDTLALEGGEVMTRTTTTVVLVWKGVMEAGAFGIPQASLQLTDAPTVSTILHLPAGVPMRVDVNLSWTGSADLNLEVFDSMTRRCRSDNGYGGTFQAVDATESCTFPWIDPGTQPREWRIGVFAFDGAQEDIPFEVTVSVATWPDLPRYDIRHGPSGSASTIPDANVPGPFQTDVAEYDFGAMVVEDPVTGRPYPVRVLGAVHHPTTGTGPFPVVVFIHGRHNSCETSLPTAGRYNSGWTSQCREAPAGFEAVPSHRGYDDVASLLASHGYVVASIDANDINVLDSPRYPVPANPPRGDDGLDARAALILRTLDEFRAVHEGGPASLATGAANPELASLEGRLDLARLGLMGHSRGAEAVTRTPAYAGEVGHWSAESYAAVYSLAGIRRFFLPDAAVPIIRGPTAYASVMPYCDGDAFWLGNADFHDLFAARADHGPLTQLLFMGANHNYYNTEWPQDDAGMKWRDDPYCRPDVTEDGVGHGRLSPADQGRHQRVYMTAFFRLHVGGEIVFAPLFTGAAPPPSGACPEGVEACPGLVHVSYHPPASARLRLLLEDAASARALGLNAVGGPSSFDGFDTVDWCDPFDLDAVTPCQWPRVAGLAPRLVLSWTGNARWRTIIPDAADDLSGFDTLAFRIGVDFVEGSAPGGIPPKLRVVVEDAGGRRSSVDVADHSGAIFRPPGLDGRRIALNQVRLPFTAFEGVDLGQVRAIEFAFPQSTPGTVQVAELMALAGGS